MNNRFLVSLLYGLFFILLLTACEHRPLTDPTDQHFLRIYLDEHIRNVSYGFYDDTKEKPEYKTPKVMCVTLSDTQTGEVMNTDYLQESGSDEFGNYVQGYIYANPGNYHLLAYNFDTESTHVRNEMSYKNMEVYTNPVDEGIRNKLESVRSIEESRAEVVRYEPDHFFVSEIKGLRLDTEYKKDTIKTHEGNYPVAESVTKTYYLQVNVKGVEYVRSAVALITGMAGSVRLHDRSMVSENPSTIYFNLKNGRSKLRSDEMATVGYATFNTFGKLPEVEGFIEITFEFHKTDETVQTETLRLTDMFETKQVKDKQWIIIDKVIEIRTPEGHGDEGGGGGMNPGVTNWEEIESEITI